MMFRSIVLATSLLTFTAIAENPGVPKPATLPADLVPAFALEFDAVEMQGAATYKAMVTGSEPSGIRLVTVAWSEGRKRHKPGHSVRFLYRLPKGKTLPLTTGDIVTLNKTPLFNKGRTGYLWTIHREEELLFAAQLYGRDQALSFELPLNAIEGATLPVIEQKSEASAREFYGESPYASESRVMAALRTAEKETAVKEGGAVAVEWNGLAYELMVTESRYAEPLAGRTEPFEGTRFTLGYLLIRTP